MDERSDADVGADHGSPAKRLTSQPSGSLVPASRWLLAGLGVFFLAAAWGLGFSATGTELHYGGALSTSSPSTANFWLAYLLLIVPGALMVGGWAGPAAHACAHASRLVIGEREYAASALDTAGGSRDPCRRARPAVDLRAAAHGGVAVPSLGPPRHRDCDGIGGVQ